MNVNKDLRVELAHTIINPAKMWSSALFEANGSSTNSMFHPQSDMNLHLSEFSASRQSRALSGIRKNKRPKDQRTRGEEINLGKIQGQRKVGSFFFFWLNV